MAGGRRGRPARRRGAREGGASASATSTRTSTSTSTRAAASAQEPPRARARAVALRYLAAAARTEAQVRARLARAELAAEADDTIRWLLGLGYLDDAAWARGRARALLGAGKAGPRLAEQRLVRAGIDRERARASVRAAVAEAGDAPGTDGEVALCRTLAERRARTADLAALDDRARARLGRFLAARGFSGPVVARVLGLWQDG